MAVAIIGSTPLEVQGGRWKPRPTRRPTPSPTLVVTPSPTVAPTPVITPSPTPVITPVPTPVVTPSPTPVVTPSPTPVITPAPTPVVTPPPTPVITPAPTPVITPTPTTPGIKSVRVTSITSLLSTLADNTVDEIVVANGTYKVTRAGAQAADSLWIGSQFAGRTRPITVRAETKGGVTFDGNGTSYFGGLSFNGGVHDQTWDGFNFANGQPTETGVIVFGGYGLASPHHITLRNITMQSSIVASTTQNDHLIYFSSDSPHDILIEDYTATPGAGIQSALQFYHSPNVYNLTVRRMHVIGTNNAILMYDGTVHDVLIADSDIKDAKVTALNVSTTGANVVLNNVISTNSGGVYYPNGKPAGLTLINCSLN